MTVCTIEKMDDYRCSYGGHGLNQLLAVWDFPAMKISSIRSAVLTHCSCLTKTADGAISQERIGLYLKTNQRQTADIPQQESSSDELCAKQ